MKRFMILLLALPFFGGLSAQVGGNYISDKGGIISVKEMAQGIILSGGGESVPYLSVGDGKYVNVSRASYVIINNSKMMIFINGVTALLYKTKRGVSGNVAPNNNSSGFQSSRPSTKSPSTCRVCNGSGYSNSVVYAPSYGAKQYDEYCSICKSSRKPHTHKLCYSCQGLGYK